MPEDWVQCDFPTPFMIDKTCVSECPQDYYYYDIRSYSWIKSNYYNNEIIKANQKCQTNILFSKENLSVKIGIKGTLSNVLNTNGGYLEMDIKNMRGSITTYIFTQIEPIPSVEFNTLFLLEREQDMHSNISETREVELNIDAILEYPIDTYFKVRAEVHNDCGDIAFDYITFARMEELSLEDIQISCQSSQWKTNETIQIEFMEHYHEFSQFSDIYIQIEIKLESNLTVLLFPAQKINSKIDIKLPIIEIKQNATLPVSFLFTGIDSYSRSISVSKKVLIENNFALESQVSLFSRFKKIDNNLNEITLFGAQIKIAYEFPKISFNNLVCNNETNCSGHGIWNHENTWNWNEGFSGIDCSIDSHDYGILKESIDVSLNYLLNSLISKDVKTRLDIESIFKVLSYLLLQFTKRLCYLICNKTF